jgi:hypothetical protein
MLRIAQVGVKADMRRSHPQCGVAGKGQGKCAGRTRSSLNALRGSWTLNISNQSI